MSCLPGGRKLMHDHVVAGAALCRDRCSRSLAVARQWGSFLSVATCETKPLFIINTHANTAPARARGARVPACPRAVAAVAGRGLARGSLLSGALGVRAAWLAVCAPWPCTSRPYDKRSIHTPLYYCAALTPRRPGIHTSARPVGTANKATRSCKAKLDTRRSRLLRSSCTPRGEVRTQRHRTHTMDHDA